MINIKRNNIAKKMSIRNSLFLIIILTFQGVYSQNISLNWQVGMSNKINVEPNNFFDATIPGAVQLDYMKANNLQHFSINNNVNDYSKLENKYWFYITSFDKPELDEKENLVFNSKGIDYEFDIILNDSLLLHQEGMFTSVRLILNQYIKEKNNLKIIIYPVPIAEGEPVGRRQAILAVKPPVAYGWDWHPRLIPVGIWDETKITKESKIKILTKDLSYELNDELSIASVNLNFKISESKLNTLSYHWNLYDTNNSNVATSYGKINDGNIELFYDLNNPILWYPHDHGTPYLYTSVLQIKDVNGNLLDETKEKVGFRKVELIMNENAWNEPIIFPKSRSVAPFTIRINNRIIFAKGSNWVHPEIFYGTITSKRYLEQLVLVKKCNMNILRIWGGGITNKKSFFEQCDSLGIMVWQEFPLACNNYPNDNHYLEILKQEAISIISNVKKHACLVMWSGGNELFNNWSGMTEQAHALRLLNSLTYQYDKNTPFINTSPIYGVAHGHYLFYDETTNEDVFQLMKRSNYTAYTEFGMPSLAPIDVLEKIIPAEELFPVKPTEAWKKHGAFDAWRSTSWLETQTIEKYFGKAENLKELVWQSQILQSIGYKAIFEESRRQKPYCSMALNWCFNEPWPNAANNNLITYPNIPKPAFNAVMASLRPVMSSAAFSRFDWNVGSTLEFDLWMLNDAYETVVNGKMNVFITMDGIKTKIGSWDCGTIGQNENKYGPTIRYFIPENIETQLVKISLELNQKEEYNSEYYLLVTSKKIEKRSVNSLNF